jgi:hypothetical protein
MGDSLPSGIDSNYPKFAPPICFGPRLEINKKRDTQVTNDDISLHRASCHRCGNLRKKKTMCSQCPYVFCARCTDKMIEEHGKDIFMNGCPVVKFSGSSFPHLRASANKNVVVVSIKLFVVKERFRFRQLP